MLQEKFQEGKGVSGKVEDWSLLDFSTKKQQERMGMGSRGRCVTSREPLLP